MDLIYRALVTKKLLTLHVPNHAAQTSRLLDLLCSKLPILPRLPFPRLSSLQRLNLSQTSTNDRAYPQYMHRLETVRNGRGMEADGKEQRLLR